MFGNKKIKIKKKKSCAILVRNSTSLALAPKALALREVVDAREALLFLDFRLDLVEFFPLSLSLICCSALVIISEPLHERELSFHAN